MPLGIHSTIYLIHFLAPSFIVPFASNFKSDLIVFDRVLSKIFFMQFFYLISEVKNAIDIKK